MPADLLSISASRRITGSLACQVNRHAPGVGQAEHVGSPICLCFQLKEELWRFQEPPPVSRARSAGCRAKSRSSRILIGSPGLCVLSVATEVHCFAPVSYIADLIWPPDWLINH